MMLLKSQSTGENNLTGTSDAIMTETIDATGAITEDDSTDTDGEPRGPTVTVKKSLVSRLMCWRK
jgi:hypothetical protein